MHMNTGLSQHQTTNLTMTQGLAQSIKLLQLSMADLTSFIQERASENPLIELEDASTKDIFVDRYNSRDKTYTVHGQNGSIPSVDVMDTSNESLRDHLLEQVRFLNLSSHKEKELRYLVCYVNEDGYFTESLDTVCLELGIQLKEGERLLKILQTFDPLGVGARDLQECLLLQLKNRSTREELAEDIISHYINEFADKKWKFIADELSISLIDVQHVHDLIQQLNPRPGSHFSHELPTYLVPDVIVMQVDGELIVSIMDEEVPKISLDHQYKTLLKEKTIDENEYLKEKYNELQWLLKSINHRQQTLYRVAKTIVDFQRDFFYKGSAALKPLTLRDIAEKLNVHESTVSRITSNKYMETPQGIFELKFFFHHSINSSTTSSHVKNLMEKLIEQENKLKPFSDQKILKLLEEEHGIQLSRRVISKYRDEMNIPSSSKRKRYLSKIG